MGTRLELVPHCAPTLISPLIIGLRRDKVSGVLSMSYMVWLDPLMGFARVCGASSLCAVCTGKYNLALTLLRVPRIRSYPLLQEWPPRARLLGGMLIPAGGR